jgi:hypothetical protein
MFEAFLNIVLDTLQTHPIWKLGPHDANQTVPTSVIWNSFSVIFDVYKQRLEIKKETVTRDVCEGISKWANYFNQQYLVGSMPEQSESDWEKFFLTFEISLTFLSSFHLPVVFDWITESPETLSTLTDLWVLDITWPSSSDLFSNLSDKRGP